MKFPFFKSKAEPQKQSRTGLAMRSNRANPRDAEILRNINGKMMRAFEAALSNGLNADFPVSISSANADIFSGLWAGRSRARTLEQNNPYAAAILETYRNNVCGDDPFRLEMHVGEWKDSGEFVEDKKINRIIEEAWKEAALPENCTVRRNLSRLELDCQALTSIIRDGGFLAKHVRAYPKNDFLYALQPLEIDRLDHFWQGKNSQTGNNIKFSIELDEWEGPVAYWLLTKHPGEIFNISDQTKRQRERIPAEDMIALFDIRTRAEQLIAMPRFVSIIQRLHRIDQFDIAHVTAAIWSACKPVWLVSDMPTAFEYIPDSVKQYIENSLENITSGGEKVSTVEPGEVEELPFGKKPVQLDPKFPVENAPEFKKEQLRAAAAGSGAAYHIIANDLESVNFSSGRLGLQEFREGCKILQRHYIYGLRRPHFNEWLKSSILSGRIPLPLTRLKEFQRAATFYGRRWPYIQPLQDAQADALRLEKRLASRDQIIAESESGGRYEQIAAQLAADYRIDEALKLPKWTPDAGEEVIPEPGQETPPNLGN